MAIMIDKQYTAWAISAILTEQYYTQVLFSFPNVTDVVLVLDIFIVNIDTEVLVRSETILDMVR